jgi:hypothetical protein
VDSLSDPISRKPLARFADFTAGNRMMWAHLPNRDSPHWVFFDKEAGLARPPDVLCRWEEIPNYFPENYFKAGIFDPQHSWFGENSIHNDPTGEKARWWGNPGNWGTLRRDIYLGQRAFAKVLDGPLLLKWNETRVNLERMLTLMTEWREVQRFPVNSSMKRGKSKTWWVKLVRKVG